MTLYVEFGVAIFMLITIIHTSNKNQIWNLYLCYQRIA